MMKVQTKKFHLEQGEKNVYVCKKDAFNFSKNQSHFSFKIHPTRNVENLSLGCCPGLGSWARAPAPPPTPPHATPHLRITPPALPAGLPQGASAEASHPLYVTPNCSVPNLRKCLLTWGNLIPKPALNESPPVGVTFETKKPGILAIVSLGLRKGD